MKLYSLAFTILFGCTNIPAQDPNSIPFSYVPVEEIAKRMGEKKDYTEISVDQMSNNIIFLENGYTVRTDDVGQLEYLAGIKTGDVHYEKENGMLRRKGSFDRRTNPEVFDETCQKVDIDGDHTITPTEVATEYQKNLFLLPK